MNIHESIKYAEIKSIKIPAARIIQCVLFLLFATISALIYFNASQFIGFPFLITCIVTGMSRSNNYISQKQIYWPYGLGMLLIIVVTIIKVLEVSK